eukprot:351548-Chlamydomonas_euryale.AAC.5
MLSSVSVKCFGRGRGEVEERREAAAQQPTGMEGRRGRQRARACRWGREAPTRLAHRLGNALAEPPHRSCLRGARCDGAISHAAGRHGGLEEAFELLGVVPGVASVRLQQHVEGRARGQRVGDAGEFLEHAADAEAWQVAGASRLRKTKCCMHDWRGCPGQGFAPANGTHHDMHTSSRNSAADRISASCRRAAKSTCDGVGVDRDGGGYVWEGGGGAFSAGDA